jgi:transcriptional regulator with XRE-family HTH domain
MSNLRRRRIAAGMTQLELARRAGVSRQLIGAVEAGRHLPRVDAAVALAAALDADVRVLFSAELNPVDVVSGDTPPDGELVRAGRIGDRVVTAASRVGPEGWDVADGVIEDGAFAPFGHSVASFVVAGCEPGLALVERILRERGMGGVAATASSAAAVDALAAGRVHAAVVHGPALARFDDRSDLNVTRFHLTRWQVGLAAAPNTAAGWWQDALSGKVPVVQREQGAGVQRTFEMAAGAAEPIPGPRVDSHYAAAQRATVTGLAAVTIEPAARAAGAQFHALEVHDAQLWIDRDWTSDSAVVAAMDVIAGVRFRRRLEAIGGYDLTGCGVLVS